MKTLISAVICILFVSTYFAQNDLLPAYPKEISYQGDIAYFDGSPFTGLLMDENTNKKIGEFRNGYKNGMFTEYYSNGKKKSECKYVNGTIDGKYVTFLENGKKETEDTYKNGKKILTGKYEDDVLLELSVEYYSNGNKRSEGNLKNGKEEGPWTIWYGLGQKKSEGYYKDGKREGKFVSWYADGRKEFEGYYVNGKLEVKTAIEEKVPLEHDIKIEDQQNEDNPSINDFVEVDKLPEILFAATPEYDETAKLAGITGKVFVKVLIDKEGKPKRAIVIKTDSDLFNDNAIAAAMESTFIPALRKNKHVAVWIVLPFRFTLEGN